LGSVAGSIAPASECNSDNKVVVAQDGGFVPVIMGSVRADLPSFSSPVKIDWLRCKPEPSFCGDQLQELVSH